MQNDNPNSTIQRGENYTLLNIGQNFKKVKLITLS